MAALLRALAQQTDWLQEENGRYLWITPEMPEGTGPERPWVEVTVDNYAGNGGCWSRTGWNEWRMTVWMQPWRRCIYDSEQAENAQIFSAVHAAPEECQTRWVQQRCI
ncbi:MAG: hypothetical protein R3E95_20595 [Thiolinea sp.]